MQKGTPIGVPFCLGENYEKYYRAVSAVTANSALSAVPPRV